MLGSSLGAVENGAFSEVRKTSFGEQLSNSSTSELSNFSSDFFTGKPNIEGLGYSFLFRNYKPETGKWMSADPIGYPNGWNNLAYCNSNPCTRVDPMGLDWWNYTDEHVMGRDGLVITYVDLSPSNPVMNIIEDYGPNMHDTSVVHDAWVGYLTNSGFPDSVANVPTMFPAYSYAFTLNLMDTGEITYDFMVNTGSSVYSYSQTGISGSYNWITDGLNNIFNPPDGTSFWQAFAGGWGIAQPNLQE